MSKRQPSKGTTYGHLNTFIDAISRLVLSRNPRERAAGYLLIAGCFLAYQESGGPLPLIT